MSRITLPISQPVYICAQLVQLTIKIMQLFLVKHVFYIYLSDYLSLFHVLKILDNLSCAFFQNSPTYY